MVQWAYAYRQNPNLPVTGYKHAFTKHEISEFIKCKNDPIYFIEKYIKIINIDKGLVPFVLYPCQHKLINSYHNERKTIILSPRQSGKCFCINTLITIKNKRYNNGKAFKIKVGEFYEWQKFIKWSKTVQELQ